jgi:enterochelin esterase-like enzyme
MPTAVPTATPSPAPTASPAATACGEQHGKIIREQLRSHSMGRIETYRVYTPACYDQQPIRRYPVVYLLHGGEHNEEHWDDVGVDDAADALIATGTIPPLLIVLPDGGQDFGPLRGNPPPFAGYLHDELIPQIDARYRSVADRADRALGGISYGAAWALLLAARYPESFSAVGAHSPAIGAFNGIYPNIQALVAGKLRIYLDVGDHDGLRRPTADLDAGLTKAGWPHEFHVYPGRHNEAYWNRHLEDYLRFYTREW